MINRLRFDGNFSERTLVFFLRFLNGRFTLE